MQVFQSLFSITGRKIYQRFYMNLALVELVLVMLIRARSEPSRCAKPQCDAVLGSFELSFQSKRLEISSQLEKCRGIAGIQHKLVCF